ncbi:hypothetical protein D0Z08_08050 [Nocardioides immobilis]|uniref:DUF3558 domain-containing protein n=2 Tax=Nocardioides immobilis TaxID=2049295 RepID=A0A417Y4L7_9ACTN|nr:hypothetical protein D0Z08_08050 [Nocardioides immobilis]
MLAVVLTTLPVATGVLVLDDEAPAMTPPEPPAYASTPLTDYDTTVVALSRAPFCDRIPEEALTEALAGDVGWTVTAYRNGQAAQMAPGVDDVAHEYGCRVDGAGLADGELRAWLFVPPVPRSRATELIADASGRPGCTRPAQAPAYGAPSVALVCPSGDRRWASFRGLFGDAWLTCSLAAPTSVPEQDLLDRAGRWCVAVAKAAAAS